jgi:mannose-6-phosphate isomerase-like protein (cupin superfamily)
MVASPINRRTLLVAGGLLPCAALDSLSTACAAASSAYTHSAGDGAKALQMHGGKGTIDVRFLFEQERAPQPALFLQYDIPPGASEGVHTHQVGHPNGPWDEFYYIVAGSGRMSVGPRQIQVRAGDAVHTPLGTPHGIENTSASEQLRVFLVAIASGSDASVLR